MFWWGALVAVLVLIGLAWWTSGKMGPDRMRDNRGARYDSNTEARGQSERWRGSGGGGGVGGDSGFTP